MTYDQRTKQEKMEDERLKDIEIKGRVFAKDLRIVSFSLVKNPPNPHAVLKEITEDEAETFGLRLVEKRE